MSLLDPKAQASLDAFVYKQLLHTAGLDRGLSGMAGMVFTDVLADALATHGTPLLPVAPATAPAGADPSVTSTFGPRLDPLTGAPAQHQGVDVASPEGTPIVATWAGTVVSAQERGGYGNAVEVDHGDGVRTLYAHARSLNVKPGDRVEAGEKLGEVGSSGRSTGPHLHLELRIHGRAVEPSAALKAYRQRADVMGREDP